MIDSSKFVNLQGKTYKLRPYSAKNAERLKVEGGKLAEQLAEQQIDTWTYYEQLLPLVIEGPYEFDTRADDFDGNDAEAAVLSFVPPSLRAYVLLAGFNPA